MQNPWVIKTTPISKFATTLSFSGPNSQVSLCYFVYPAQPLRSKLLLLILKKKKKNSSYLLSTFFLKFLFYFILIYYNIYIYIFIYKIPTLVRSKRFSQETYAHVQPHLPETKKIWISSRNNKNRATATNPSSK